jgi:uncharacterized BrkB/YihY/UPF0761 family membrane protein
VTIRCNHRSGPGTGAAITAVLFIIGRYVIAWYLAYTAPASA